MFNHTTTTGNYRVRYLEVQGQPEYFVESESEHKGCDPEGKLIEYTTWSVVGSFHPQRHMAVAHAEQLERVDEINRVRLNETLPNIQWRTGDSDGIPNH